MLSSVLTIEQLLKCEICYSMLKKPRLVGECGHRFCGECITTHMEHIPSCPKCQTPTDIDNLKNDPIHDHLTSYINKLKRAFLSHSLTPLEDSLLRREEEDESSNTRKRNIIDTQDSEDLASEFRDDPKRFKPDDTADFIGELLSDERPTRRRNVPKPDYSIPTEKDVEMPDSTLFTKPTLVGAPVSEKPLPLDLPDIEDMDKMEEEVEKPREKPVKKRSKRTPELTKTSDKTWDCPDCGYTTKAYRQTCDVCKKSKNTKVQAPASRRSKSSRSTAALTNTDATTVPEHTLESATVAPPIPSKSKVDMKREIHIIKTSLKPTDEESLEASDKKVCETPLQVTLHTEIKAFDEITHVISSVDHKMQSARTLKYLYGLLLGKWIVSPKWYIDSIKAKKWLPEDGYEVQGDTQSGLTHAPTKARTEFSEGHRLFTDMQFYLSGTFNDKHSKRDIITLIKAGEGGVVTRKPSKKTDAIQPIIINGSTTKKQPDWMEDYEVRDPTWIVNSISHLKLQK